MKRSAILVILTLGIALPQSASAKKNKRPRPTAQELQNKKQQEEKPPAPNDKGVNESGQGRKNATEDAARDADSPAFQHRP